MKISCIYAITSKINGKVYIGSSVNFVRRKRDHLNRLSSNVHSNKKIQYHYNKYGKDDLSIEILEIVENKCLLVEREQYFIDNLHPEFNISPTAGSPLGVKNPKASMLNKNRIWTRESREKLSIAGKNRKHSELTRLKISNANKGKEKSDSHKKKLSSMKIGNTIWLGRAHSNESKLKMSESHKRENLSPETLRKMSNASKGRIPCNRKTILQYNKEGEFIREYSSIAEATRLTKIKSISQAVNGLLKTSGGYIWKYKNRSVV